MAGNTMQVIDAQLQAVFDTMDDNAFAGSVLAYEPVWAIGTGETATPDQAQEVHAHIRNVVASKDAGNAAAIQILYGGSVKPGNAEELFNQPDIDGGLIGGAALKSTDFVAICKAAQNRAAQA